MCSFDEESNLRVSELFKKPHQVHRLSTDWRLDDVLLIAGA